jgi:predicted protein tyrosine phosphatase
MDVKISSIKNAQTEFKNIDTDNIKVIIASSYEKNIESIKDENKLVLYFDDITTAGKNSFNRSIANKINTFVEKVDFSKDKLYICCDSGVSRSSAIAAAILRKYKRDENVIWKDYMYQPNIFVYKTLCDEFKLGNNYMRLRYKERLNKKALKRKIDESRRISQ